MANLEMKFLLVDDFQSMLLVTDSLLRQMGFKDIDHAQNGQEALEKLKWKKYDVILSDWNMEPMSGLELLMAVRANDTLKKIPFILITAESKPENIIVAKKAGVTNYIVKPISADALKLKLTPIVGAF